MTRNHLRAFALPYVLFVILFLLTAGFFLIQQFMHSEKVEFSWHSLDQAQINRLNAVNHFYNGQKGFTQNEAKVVFEFAPRNGFEYKCIPLGAYWLADINGFAGNHDLQQRAILGSHYRLDQTLIMDSKLASLRTSAQTQVDGKVQFLEDTDPKTEQHPLFDQADFDRFPKYVDESLIEHLTFQFSEQWREQLQTMFGSVDFREVETKQLALDSLTTQAQLIVLRAQKFLTLTGNQPENSPPIIILAEEELNLQGVSNINHLWILSKSQVLAQDQLMGYQLHIAAAAFSGRSLDLDLKQSSIFTMPWFGNKGIKASVGISGKGRFEGALIALDSPSEKGASMYKDKNIETAGYIYSDGVVNLLGKHQGNILGTTWVYEEGGNVFPNRMADIQLTVGIGSPGPWSLPGGKPTIVSTWGLP
jgi:hypothetical protein